MYTTSLISVLPKSNRFRFGNQKHPMSFPPVVYHLTYEDRWKEIKTSGGLKIPTRKKRPVNDKDFGAIFAVDEATLKSKWCRPTRFFGSYIQAMTLKMKKYYDQRGQNAVMLAITLDPQHDTLFVRDVSPVMDHLDPYGFVKSRKPISEYRSQATDIPEFMITNNIPLSRIQLVRVIKPDNFPAAKEYGQYTVENPLEIYQRLVDPNLPAFAVNHAKPIHKQYYYRIALLKYLFHRFTCGLFYAPKA